MDNIFKSEWKQAGEADCPIGSSEKLFDLKNKMATLTALHELELLE